MEKVSTGIEGLDDILQGGLPRNRIYLVQGDPGVGKTTFGLQFLLEGVKQGESCLYVTLSETADELKGVADSHGWSMKDIALHELTALDTTVVPEGPNTLFHPSEVELQETTQSILAIVEKSKPTRVVFDSLSELRLLAQSPLRYRRQILWLKQFFVGRNCTVIFLDDRTGENDSNHLQSLAHGVLVLERLAPLYGAERRRLQVVKLRGVKFRGGYHDYNILTGGIDIFPRLVANEHHQDFQSDQIPSGITGIDTMLGGGLDRGTSTLILGPAGTGKSVLASQYAIAAAKRGERAALYVFDENASTLLFRSESLGMELNEYVKKGLIKIEQIDPAELSPGEFVSRVRDSVEKNQTKVIVIDSLNGYMHSMPEEQFLTLQLHELLSYLRQQGVLTVMVVAQAGMMGSGMVAPVDVSYLADTVIITRYFEARGQIRKAVSVLKKRTGLHETSIREMCIGPKSLRVGEPLNAFHGILSGIPTCPEDEVPLLQHK